MRKDTLRKAARWLVLATLLLVALPASASAVDPETTIGGANSEWFSGSFLQMEGENCSIIGNSYSETMVSAIASYGGRPQGQLVHVGDRYYAEVLVSIPGNPCGSGSSSVGTDLFLPRGVSVDTSAPIRCFGQPRNASAPGELTGGNWSFNGSSGPYCPASVGPSQSGAPGTIGVGFRPLASGVLYWLFVPIKSNQSLQGAGHSPADEIHWFISASAPYVSPQAASVWVNVVDAGGGGTPYIYFARNPSVVPFYDSAAPSGQQNKAEWFANLYSAGYAGTLCFELHEAPTATDPLPLTCADATGWNGTVTTASDSWQIFGSGASAGPNGGYVPFAYPNPNEPWTIRWKFTYNPGGGNQTVFKDISFTTLAGPDTDGDGVPDASDACNGVKGTQANGCQPPVPDPDGDGIRGSADKCPNQAGGGSSDGCPVAAKDSDGDGISDANDACPTVAASTTNGCPLAVAFSASLGAIKGNKLKRKDLAKGVSLSIACVLDSKATATLSVSRAVAKKLKLKLTSKQKTLAIGSGSASCKGGKAGKLKLRLKSALAAKVRKPRKSVAATLILVFTRAGSKPVTVRRAVTLT